MLEDLPAPPKLMFYPHNCDNYGCQNEASLKPNFFGIYVEEVQSEILVKQSLIYSEDSCNTIQSILHPRKHQTQQMVNQALKKVNNVLNIEEDLLNQTLLNTIQLQKNVKQNKLDINKLKNQQFEINLNQFSKWKKPKQRQNPLLKVKANAKELIQLKQRNLQDKNQNEYKNSYAKKVIIRNKYQGNIIHKEYYNNRLPAIDKKKDHILKDMRINKFSTQRINHKSNHIQNTNIPVKSNSYHTQNKKQYQKRNNQRIFQDMTKNYELNTTQRQFQVYIQNCFRPNFNPLQKKNQQHFKEKFQIRYNELILFTIFTFRIQKYMFTLNCIKNITYFVKQIFIYLIATYKSASLILFQIYCFCIYLIWEEQFILNNQKNINKMYSFENFPENQKIAVKLTPRSQEALKRTGYSINDLLIKTAQEINQKYNDNVTETTLIQKRLEHYEEKRLQRLFALKQVRTQVVQQQSKGQWAQNSGTKSRMQSAMVSGGAQKSSLIQNELKQLQKIKFKQQKQIQQTIQYEMKMEEIRKINEEKMQKQKEKQDKRKQELEEKKKYQQEMKRIKDQEAKRKQEEQQLAQQKIYQESKLKQQQQLENQRRKQREREQRNRKIQEEKKMKQEQFLKQKQKNLQEQQEQVEKRRIEMEKKQEERIKNMAMANEKKKQQSQLKRHEKEQKLRLARQRNEEALSQLNQKFKQREKQLQQRRQQFEMQKKKHAEEIKVKSQQHNQKMKQVIENNTKIQEKKKQQYYQKQKQAQMRKKELDELQNLQMENKKKMEEERQLERKKIRENNQRQMEDKKHFMLKKLQAKEESLVKVQKSKQQKMKEKHNDDIIKRTDKRDNVERIMKVQQYEKHKLLEKIQEKMEKADHIKQERQQLLDQRQLMKKQVEKQKRQMMEKIQKLKQGKIDPNQLLKSLSMQTNQNISIVTHQNKKIQKQQPKKQLQPIKQKKKVNKTQPVHQKTQIPVEKKKNADDAKKQLNDLIEKHNSEMLKLLQDEQQAENLRQQKFVKASPEEKRKFQKQFGLQRAKAQTRIQKLSDAHSSQIRKFKAKNGLRS